MFGNNHLYKHVYLKNQLFFPILLNCKMFFIPPKLRSFKATNEFHGTRQKNSINKIQGRSGIFYISQFRTINIKVKHL